MSSADEGGRALLREWGLPLEVIEAYQAKGVSKLFPWQIRLMQETNCLKNRHLIYSAPTGSGKTMVAELLMFRMCMLQEKKAIFMPVNMGVYGAAGSFV